ncbi:MAG: hypothetical protein JW724_03405 [Candidatus Altiarchaeota archaeon]|nr:hypothetical protein [Candidatus Altiarchaeota archaeon]
MNTMVMRSCTARRPRRSGERYIVLKGFVDGEYCVRGCVKYDGVRIHVETYHASLTEAMAQEIGEKYPGMGGDRILEELRNLLDTPLLADSEVRSGRVRLDSNRIVYGAEVSTRPVVPSAAAGC